MEPDEEGPLLADPLLVGGQVKTKGQRAERDVQPVKVEVQYGGLVDLRGGEDKASSAQCSTSAIPTQRQTHQFKVSREDEREDAQDEDPVLDPVCLLVPVLHGCDGEEVAPVAAHTPRSLGSRLVQVLLAHRVHELPVRATLTGLIPGQDLRRASEGVIGRRGQDR